MLIRENAEKHDAGFTFCVRQVSPCHGREAILTMIPWKVAKPILPSVGIYQRVIIADLHIKSRSNRLIMVIQSGVGFM